MFAVKISGLCSVYCTAIACFPACVSISYPVRVCEAGLCIWSRRFVYVYMYNYVVKKQAV